MPAPAVVEESAPVPVSALPPLQCPSSLSAPALEAIVRRVVREEVEPTLAARASDAKQQPEDAEPSEESVAAYANAMRIVRAAIAGHLWRAADREALSQLLPSLTNAQQKEVLSTLLPAMNSGEVKPDSAVLGPPI